MYDNLLRHKILQRLIQYKTMFSMKKDSYFSIENLHEFFPKEKRVDTALVTLISEGYVTLKKEDNRKMVNIEEKGVFAVNNSLFKKKEHNLWWTFFKDGGLVIANIVVAVIALYVVNKMTLNLLKKMI